ncbi:uncharacterized protein LOC115405828 [Salarias fasciatus]|uniref:Uncharacterized LOC115405828 n=1 Tax=Salarias fasciatus TaxID=181472 RepID=A0A672INF8_SALFA|nr:uncharacterized protein LOC115405828 [Salarias fasciatus]
MKPISYQSMPSSVHGGHPTVDHVLSTSKVMYCEKCGFASTDASVFNKHVMEHAGTRFYCFYCNKVSFSEAELNAHLKQHTSKYPFICPHCGQGYMRRLCLVKHIDRLHSKIISQGPPKPGMTKAPLVPVCSALTSTSTADSAPLRPLVRVSVPPPSIPAVRLGKDEQRGKTMDTNVSHVANGISERSPFNGLIQHNRALTVSLPEEVSIPAGCLVELVEVKTVNGTKELKLRLVSQQENESVIKDTRTMVPQNLALGKPLSSTVNHPNTARSNSMGTCIVNRKQCEQKAVTVEHPAPAPVSISNSLPNTVIKEKCGLKRPTQEIINLDSSPVLNKIQKTILNPVREGNSSTRLPPAPVSPKAMPSTVAPRGVISMLNSTMHPDSKVTGVSPRVVEERKLGRPELFLNIPPRRTSDPKNIRDVSVAVKVEPGVSHLKSSAVPKTMKESVSMTPQCLKPAPPSVSVPVVTAAQIRPPAVSLSKDTVVNKPFSLSRTPNIPLSIKTDFLSNYKTSEIFSRSQDVRFNEMRKPESFPVISSVFSLSQQPEDDQGPIKPLVMALRGIVMDKNPGSASATQNEAKMPRITEEINKAPLTGRCAQVDTKNEPLTHDLTLTEQINDSVKEKDSVKEEKPDKGDQQPSAPTPEDTCVNEEQNHSLPDAIKSSESTDSKSNTDEESQISSCAEASPNPDPPQQEVRTEQGISSKYLTVSLKRVQVGVWKKCKKRLKLRISRYKTRVPVGDSWTVIYPTPLKLDQLVKQPGPNQPVVVLNHPKPRLPPRGLRTEGSQVVPEYHILKMRLSKVMGRKYKVIGYTVRFLS